MAKEQDYERIEFNFITDKDWKTELKERYEDRINTVGTILALLKNNHGSIWDVSYEMGYGICYDDLLDLCAGYIFGTKTMKRKILDFLEDINFHTEYALLENDAEKFYQDVTDENSEYYKTHWVTWTVHTVE